MTNWQDLDEMEALLSSAREVYRPTPFWSQSCIDISNEIRKQGLDNFRKLPINLDYFVPTYGHPGNSLRSEDLVNLKNLIENTMVAAPKASQLIENLLSGYTQAQSDFRTLLASDNTEIEPYLHNFSESVVGNPKEQFTFQQRTFSRSSLNYLLGLSLLKKHLNGFVPKVVLEIGGGFGSLGEILGSQKDLDSKYIDVDIPPMHFIAQYYLSQVFGEKNVKTANEFLDDEVISIEDLPAFTTLSSWQIQLLQGDVDLFVNFISFQEMEPFVVENYLNQVERLGAKWILLRNMREGKQIKSLESTGVENQTLSEDYITLLKKSYDFVNRNVIPFGFETVDGFHSELLLFRRRMSQ